MRRAVQLAHNARGKTAPNPLVGAVIVHEGKIIGEGYHKKAGEPHAEPNAVNSVRDKSLLKNATLYVTLEPCNHRGKTPACTRLILQHKIPRVFVGMQDPHSKVAGSGIKRLTENGVEVITGVLEDECKKLNPVFITNHVKQRPYITLKWAQTGNGFIDESRQPGSDQKPLKISGKTTAIFTHKMRANHDAIMVGRTTAYLDNPGLTANLWNYNHPVRVTLDRYLQLPSTLKMFHPPGNCIVFTESKNRDTETVQYIKVPFDKNLFTRILSELLKRDITSIFVEGGSTLLQTFIDSHLWDEAFVYTNNSQISSGVKAPVFNLSPRETKTLDGDIIQRYIHTENSAIK